MKRFASYFELIVWASALLALAMMNPGESAHYSLCVFRWMGIEFCPGCGLGHAVSWLFHGNISASLRAHPLGIFAVAVLLQRIFVLLNKQFSFFTTLIK